MKTKSLVFSLMLALFSISVYAADDRYEQVKFPRGASGTSIKSSITGYQGVNYTLDAKAGQTMTVKLQPSNLSNYFNIYAPGKGPGNEALFIGELNDNKFSAILPATGTYTIQVFLMRNAARRNERSNYTLDISIR
ncbi:MAG: DNA breaking-rejoining protein [Chlorobiaceae bacterium]|nr:DNA breaking-rejoining protein [Chlorobiaceae bacterium]